MAVSPVHHGRHGQAAVQCARPTAYGAVLYDRGLSDRGDLYDGDLLYDRGPSSSLVHGWVRVHRVFFHVQEHLISAIQARVDMPRRGSFLGQKRKK